MEDGYFTLMQQLAPDLAQEIELRALVLERIGALQPWADGSWPPGSTCRSARYARWRRC